MLTRMDTERYKNADPDSEEDIWIPIKARDDVDP